MNNMIYSYGCTVGVDGFFGYADLKLAEHMKVEKYILSKLIPHVDEIIWDHWYLF
jgi:hypothetical protein